MTRLTRVAVIGGGLSSEHAVSLASARSVVGGLAATHDVVRLTLQRDGSWSSPDHPLRGGSLAGAAELLSGVDVVFPTLHGPHGEDGTIAGLLDLIGVPYVGAGVRGGALAMDKWVTKLVAHAHGIGVAAGVVLTKSGPVTGLPSPPWVVKPVAAGSSHGVSWVQGPAELPRALEAAFELDDRVLVEQVVRGREVDVAAIEHPDGLLQVSPPLEITLPEGRRVFDAVNKYDGSAAFTVPCSVTDAEGQALREAARTLFRVLGCRGVARFDFFLTGGGLVLNEVNTSPGLTEHSQVPRMMAAAGLAYPELLSLLVRGAGAGRSRHGTS